MNESATISEHERQYNPRVTVGDPQPYFDRYEALSRQARDHLPGMRELRYGERPLMVCDVFPAAVPASPVHVFVHGGYWRGLDKADFSYVAATLVPAGITTVIANYDLCPSVSLPEIVDEIVALFDWLPGMLPDHNGHPGRITASGHSAGAHLIAMAHAGSLKQAVPRHRVRHAVLISGLYDLEPVLGVSVNDIIGLNPAMAFDMSPLRHPPPPELPLDISVGGRESSQWIAQSRRFAEALRQSGSSAGFEILDEHDHYSIIEALANPSSPLSRLIIERTLAVRG